MAANKTSAVADEPIDVLFALHPKFDLLDFAGPAEVFTTALHDFKDSASKAFEITLAAAEPKVLSEQGVIIGSQISFKEAHDRLEEYDVLVILGGNSAEILEKEQEPSSLIVDFSELQKKDPARERTILSICTGALFLAKEGILSGLSATTHPDFMTTFENLCSEAATRNLQERTDVVEDARYVVNNLRFDLGDEDENPYIRRKSDSGRRPSNARYVPRGSLQC
jgi:transcriptional regulator GlxA family with amidase domain